MMINRMIAVIALLSVVVVAGAQNPRKVAEVYETEVFGFGQDTGFDAGFLLPAKLIVRPASLNGGVTSITLELSEATTVPLIRFTKYSLPSEYESLLEEQGEILLDTGRHGMTGMGRQFDVTALASGRDAGAASYHVLVQNALGQPAAGVKLEIRAGSKNGFSLGSRTVSPDGRVRLQIPRQGAPTSRLPSTAFVFNPNSILHITATDPSGQRQTVQFPSAVQPGNPGNYETLNLAFVPRETTGTAFRGQVLDSDGKPSPATALHPQWLSFAGRGGLQITGMGGTVYPAPDGSFCFGISSAILQERLGAPTLPTSATLRVSIPGLPGAELSGDKETVIRLPHTEDVRVRLVDGNGSPVTGLDPKNIRLETRTTLNSTEEPSAILHLKASLEDADQAVLRISAVPVPARYSFKVNNRRFEPVFLDKGASSNIVELTQVNAASRVHGRVLEAETGKPIAGAYVLSAWEQDAPRIFSKTPAELLESTWAEWDPAAVAIDAPQKDFQFKHGTIFNADGVTKTDDDGQFQLDYDNGRDPKAVHVYIPGRMAATARVLDMEKPAGTPTIYKLPDVALPLGASVIVPVVPPDRVPDKYLVGPGVAGDQLKNVFSVSASFQPSGSWNAAVPDGDYRKRNPWSLLTSSGWQSPGNQPVLVVPAGVKFQVTVGAPYELTVGTASWSDLGPLTAGETQELPRKKIAEKIPFLVTVKKSDGTPASGISVRIDGELPLTTDSEGNVIGWTQGHVRRVEAITENSWKVAAQKQDITVIAGDDLTKVELIIP